MLKQYQIIFIIVVLGFTSCIRSSKQPGRQYMPDMANAIGYEAGSPNPIFKDGKTNQLSPEGSVARDKYLYPLSDSDYEKAATLITNPFTFTKDDKFLFSGGEDRIARMWNLETGKLVKEFKGHAQRIFCLDVTPDGKRLATGSSDLTLRLWDVKTGESVMIISDFNNPVYNILFYPDGKKMIVNSSGAEVLVYDASP